jgi:hypothetical protein
MSKKTTAVIKARRNVLPTAGAPALAPARPLDPDEAETAAVRASDPHRTGADRTARIKADGAATRERLAHKKATGKLAAPLKPVAKAAAKPVAKAKKKPVLAKPAAPASSTRRNDGKQEATR